MNKIQQERQNKYNIEEEKTGENTQIKRKEKEREREKERDKNQN